MPRLLAILLLVLVCCLPGEAETRVYVSRFGSGRLVAFDVDGRRVAFTLPVEDRAGIIGVAVSRDGGTVYVVDGASRLRIVDAATGNVRSTTPFEGRVLMLGGANPLHLAPDGRSLLVRCFDMQTRSASVRIFDVERHRFLSVRPFPADTVRFENGDRLLFVVRAGRADAYALGGGAWRRVGSRALSIPDVWGATAHGDVLYLASAPGVQWSIAEWKVRTNELLSVDLLKGASVPHDPEGNAVTLCACADNVAVGHGGWLGFLNPATLSLRRTVRLAGGRGEASAFSPDGRRLLVVTADRHLVAVDPANGTQQDLSSLPFDSGGPPVDLFLAP